MPKTKSMKQEDNKTKVYECAHYEYEYDGFDKYAWCKCRESGHRECPAEHIYSMQFCPCYKQGNLRGEWVVSADEIKIAEDFRKQMEQERKDKETQERAMLKYLKEKYES